MANEMMLLNQFDAGRVESAQSGPGPVLPEC